ncbi:MAG: hypothetical protein AAFY32_09340, partial [Pseudomonadota bacterium]
FMRPKTSSTTCVAEAKTRKMEETPQGQFGRHERVGGRFGASTNRIDIVEHAGIAGERHETGT